MWAEIQTRGSKSGDQTQSIVCTDPQQTAALLYEFQAGNTTGSVWQNALGQTAGTGLWQNLRRPVLNQRSKFQILVPVHSTAPQHWTLLVLDRPAVEAEAEPAAWSVQYFESLPKPSDSATDKASKYVQLFQHLLQPGIVSAAADASLPVQPSRKQTDGWSCGYFVLLWMEQQYRQARGEGQILLPVDWGGRRQYYNSFLGGLLKYQKAKEAPKTASTGAAAITDSAAAAAITDSAAAAAAAAITDSAAGPPMQPGSLQDDNQWGCSKCRFSQKGCQMCNPYKMHKAAARKLKLEKEQADPVVLAAAPGQPTEKSDQA